MIYNIIEKNTHTELKKKTIQQTKRTQILTCKNIYLGPTILETSKMLMYEFWYDCVKPKLEKNQSYVNWIQIAL